MPRWYRVRRGLSVSLVLAVSGLAQPLAAAPAASSSQQREAKQHAAAGADALQKGDAETAIREFSTARDLAPSAEILLNLARAYRANGDYVQAKAVLESLLADYQK